MFKLQYIYYALMTACFIISLLDLREYRIRILSILLFMSIITEVMAEIFMHNGLNYFLFYHIFTITEYGLITLWLSSGVEAKTVKKVMTGSIPVFAIGALFIGYYRQGFNNMPTISNGIEGLLIICWSLYALWNIEPTDDKSIFKDYTFWIIIAFFVYYITTLPFNGFYNALINTPETEAKARINFSIINSIGNYCLYLLMLVGLYFYQWKKSTQRL